MFSGKFDEFESRNENASNYVLFSTKSFEFKIIKKKVNCYQRGQSKHPWGRIQTSQEQRLTFR
jgi:hypothetical protein